MADTKAEPGLNSDAIGFTDALVIGLAATSPAYSLAAVIGPIAVARRRARTGRPAGRASSR